MLLSTSSMNPADWHCIVQSLCTAEVARWQQGDKGMLSPAATLPRALWQKEGVFFEAWCRPLWALLPVVMAHQSEKAEKAPLPTWVNDLLQIYRETLVEGTTPGSPACWSPLFDQEQRLVDSALLGLALAVCPQLMGQGMSQQERRQVVHWLAGCADCAYHENNWRFFRVIVLLGLQKFIIEWGDEAGWLDACKHWDAVMENDLQFIHSLYLGNGWYEDGINGLLDWYNPFGFHFYGVLFCYLHPSSPHAPVFLSRAHDFIEMNARLFATDGAGVSFGRSMCYRFAQGSFWAICAFGGIYREADSRLPSWWSLGYLRTMLTRHFAFWWKQPILLPDGCLSVGYAYPNWQISEEYNAFGSPSWAGKFFWFLALPSTHPFWQAPESVEAGPADGDMAVPEARWITRRTEQGGHAWLLNGGQWREIWMPRHGAEKYAKFAYSSHFGFAVSTAQRGLLYTALDSSLAVSEEGELWLVRARTEAHVVEKHQLSSLWRPWPRRKTSIRSWLVPWGVGYCRIHLFFTDEKLLFCEGGFACPDEGKPEIAAMPGVVLRGGTLISGGRVLISGGSCGEVIETAHQLCSQSHVLFPQAHVPMVRGEIGPGFAIVVSLWTATVNPETPWQDFCETQAFLKWEPESSSGELTLATPRKQQRVALSASQILTC